MSADPQPGDAVVREAVPADLGHLAGVELAAAGRFRHAGIHGDFLLDTIAPADLAEACQEGRLWVATARGRCVGFAVASVLDDGQAWLDEVDVLPDCGGRGIGRALVERALQWTRRRGSESLGLCTFRDVPWNEPFYRRLGFLVLDVASYTDAIRRVLDVEKRRGLPMDARVVMRLDLRAGAEPSRATGPPRE